MLYLFAGFDLNPAELTFFYIAVLTPLALVFGGIGMTIFGRAKRSKKLQFIGLGMASIILLPLIPVLVLGVGSSIIKGNAFRTTNQPFYVPAEQYVAIDHRISDNKGNVSGYKIELNHPWERVYVMKYDQDAKTYVNPESNLCDFGNTVDKYSSYNEVGSCELVLSKQDATIYREKSPTLDNGVYHYYGMIKDQRLFVLADYSLSGGAPTDFSYDERAASLLLSLHVYDQNTSPSKYTIKR
ncbi:MAG: hypothetical protein JWO35_850 [Candidatus Saccharibacteria bacterium]|nr:hypothetical protein [Candidatus Saccharibacteria bacterium]